MKASIHTARSDAPTTPSFLHVGKDPRMSIAGTEISFLLAAKPSRSWLEAQAHDLLFAPGRRLIDRGHLGRLAAEWERGAVRAPWSPQLAPHPPRTAAVVMRARV